MQVIHTEPVLFYDNATKTYFKAYLGDIVKWVKTINRELFEMWNFVEKRSDLDDILDELSKELGLETRTAFFRFEHSPHYNLQYMDFDVALVFTEDGTPCYTISWIFYYIDNFDIWG